MKYVGNIIINYPFVMFALNIGFMTEFFMRMKQQPTPQSLGFTTAHKPLLRVNFSIDVLYLSQIEC